MLTALRILRDVLVYRLSRLEMANLGGALSVMLALSLGWKDVAVRTGFALLLNLLAYLTNDYCDIERDLEAARAKEKTRFLAEHRGAALGAQIGLMAVLAAIALAWSPGLLVAAALGEGLCYLYSSRLKRAAFADVVVMAFCGAAMALVAVPLDRTLGFLLVAELGLFSACFELIQVLRDREEDARAGVRTTAVVLGEARSLWVLRGLMLLAAASATLALHRFFGPLIAVAALLPYTPGGAKSYWNRVRLVFGLSWLGLIAAIVWNHSTDGALLLLESGVRHALTAW
jgi:lycopene elongase/hydratase (dihydrobisanhydrobacterioruberin-forming)